MPHRVTEWTTALGDVLTGGPLAKDHWKYLGVVVAATTLAAGPRHRGGDGDDRRDSLGKQVVRAGAWGPALERLNRRAADFLWAGASPTQRANRWNTYLVSL